MAVDHHSESGSLRFYIELGEIMQHINRHAADLNDLGLGQFSGPFPSVDIASNRRHGRQSRELIKNLERAHVPGMNDAVASTQPCHRFRTKQSVRVGNNANDDSSFQFVDSDLQK